MDTNKNRNIAGNAIIFFIIVYATMFLFGFVENIKGVTFPLIKTEFGVQYDSQGGLVSITWMGYVASCLVASLFMQRFGIKKSVLTGYILVFIGAIATMGAPSFWTATLTLLLINTGFGFFEIGNNALGTVVFKKKAALMMNLLHFFYGFGAILGPKTAGLFTNNFGFGWRQVYMAVLIPMAAVFVIILFTKLNENSEEKKQQEHTPKITFGTILKNPIVWLFCLTLGFMEVVEFGAANWGGLFLKDVYGLDPRTLGASFVALFYILFTLTRLFSGWTIEKIGYIRSLYISIIATIVIFALGFGLGKSGIWVLPFSGFFIGVMWPTIMAVAMQVFGDSTPIVISVIITISGAINGVFQMIIGLTNHYIGEEWGYRSCLIYAVVSLVFLYLLSTKISKDKKINAQ